MGTVGEMVEARANALGTGICIPAPGDVAVVPATVPPSMVEDILRWLGIWDAEVLEGELEVRGYTECGCDVYVIEKEIADGQHRVIGRIGDNHSGTFAGTPVRIIVLAAKEEK